MDSNTGYTVTPSVSYSETGEEIIDYDNAFLSTGNNLHHEDYQADIRFNPSTGEQALGIEPSFDYDPDDPEHQRTGDDMLWESVHEVYPDLDDAVQFAAHFYEGDQIDAFNHAVEIGDWDTIMPFLETMIADYHMHGDHMQVSSLSKTIRSMTLMSMSSLRSSPKVSSMSYGDVPGICRVCCR